MLALQENDFINELTEQAIRLHAEERRITFESVQLVGELESRKAWFILGISVENYARQIGLTPSKYWKRAAAAKIFGRFPIAVEYFQSGEIGVSQLAMAAGRITDANHALILDGMRNKSKRETELFLSRVTCDGRLLDREGFVEFTVRLSESAKKVFERAREVLAHGGHVPSNAEIILQAAMDLLERRDPLKKAERSAARAAKAGRENTKPNFLSIKEEDPSLESPLAFHPEEVVDQTKPAVRKSIPGDLKNAVWLRDGGRCTYKHGDGSRCESKTMIELDHEVMVCRGGQNNIDNLRLRCRYHNQHEAEMLLAAHRSRRRF